MWTFTPTVAGPAFSPTTSVSLPPTVFFLLLRPVGITRRTDKVVLSKGRLEPQSQKPTLVVSQKVGCELTCPLKNLFGYPDGLSGFFVLVYIKWAVKTEKKELIRMIH